MKQRVALYGILSSLGLIASYIEALIPIPVPVPGIKLGLANVVTTTVLYLMGIRGALFISLVRVIASGFLFGNLSAILYSLSGALLSLFVMQLLRHTGKFSVIGVSIAGGVFHNVGQLLMACLVVQNIHLFYYFPVLLFAGMLTGCLTGCVDKEILKRISRKELKI